MAAQAQRTGSTSTRATRLKALTVLRLPLQWPMVRAALKVARA
jgi:hypothetical protein